MTKKPFLIIQHMSWEGPGAHLVKALAEFGLRYQVCEVWHESLPTLVPFAGMIVLGGSPNVDEEEAYPYLAPLKALIREVIATGKAYLGFCLGHQLLGAVLGCRVGPLPKKSVGLIQGELTPAGQFHPVFAALTSELQLFKWHGQGVHLPLPPGVTHLAASGAAPVEALGLSHNHRVVGVQFDNHVDAADVARWLQSDGDWALAGTGVEPAALVAAVKSREPDMGREFRQFMRNFLEIAQLL